jgi:hypothetical protein
VRGSPVHDPLGGDRADAGQPIKLLKSRRVQIDRPRRAGASCCRAIDRLSRRWRHTDQQLLAVGQPPGDVEAQQVGTGQRATDRGQRVSHPRAVR